MNNRLTRKVDSLTQSIEDLTGVNEDRIFIYRGRDAFRKDQKRIARYKNTHVIIISPAKPKEVEVNEND